MTVEDALTSGRAGSGRLVLVTGPAGAGKTRLAETLCRAARRDGTAVTWTVAGRSGAPAFWPWTQVLAAVPPAVRERHPLAGRLLAGSGDEPSGRFALFDDLAGLLADAGRVTPLLLVLDDLHDADAASLLALDHLAPLLRTMPVVVVATVRTDAEPDRAEWAAVWPELVRHAELAPVGPLPPAEIAALVSDATGRPADPRVVARIGERTGGNALFVCELVRLLADGSGDVDALPPTVRAAISARVAQRTPPCRRVVSAAAVIGARVPLDLLLAVIDEPVDDVAAAVDDAVRHGLLLRPEPGQLAFVHEIVRDAVYDLLPEAHRMHRHRAVAEQVAARGAAADAAHHFRLAGPQHRRDAAVWALQAGRASLAMLAYEDAAAQLRAGLDAAPSPGPVHVLLGTALLAAGDSTAARAAFLTAADLARTAGDGPLLADAALGLGAGTAGFEVVLNDREQIAALEDALDLLGDGDPARRAAVMARLSVALTFAGAEDRRRRLAGDAVDLARSCGADDALAAALGAFCDVIAGPGHSRRRLELAGEIVEIAQRLRDPAPELLGRRHRLQARHELGDVGGVEDEIRAYEIGARSLRQPLYSWYVPLWRAGLAFMQGRIADCRELLAAAAELGARAGSVNAQALVPTLRWFIAGELADLDENRALFDEVELDDALGPWVPITRALQSAQVGDLAAARARLDLAAHLLETLPRDGEWLPTVTQAAEAVALVGGHPIADRLYCELTPFASEFVVEGIGAAPRGSVERHLGLLAAARGERAAALGHFERALAANRRLGAALLVARTLFDAGTAMQREDWTGEAREFYAAIGAPGRVAALGAAGTGDLAGTGVPTAPGEAALRRDGEVWTAVFAGRTVTVRDSKGVRDLAVLLARPGRGVAAVDLAAAGPAAQPGPAAPGAAEQGLHQPGDLGEVIDATARQAYRDRLVALEAEADDADRSGDPVRAAVVAAERDALLAELSAAYGLGGRPRRAGSPVERARTTVTARIRDAIRRVGAVHPELGRHLRAAVRTGTICTYEPETPVAWHVATRAEGRVGSRLTS